MNDPIIHIPLNSFLRANDVVGDLGTETVDLIVGTQRKEFRVSKKKLCDKVPYFAAMFNSFSEATSLAGTFPEDNPRDFKILLY